MGNAAAKSLQGVLAGNMADLKSTFDKYDKDKSGALEGKEALAFAKHAQEILSKSSDEEVRKLAVAANAEEWVTKFADTSGDGHVQWKEFEHWCKSVGTPEDKVEKVAKSKKEKDGKDKKEGHGDDDKKEKKDKKDKKEKGSGDEKKEKKDKKDSGDEKKDKKDKKDKK